MSPGKRTGIAALSLEEMDKLLGYEGSIQGTPLDDALDEQRAAIHRAQAVIECVNVYIEQNMDQTGQEWRSGLALDAAKRMLDEIWESLDAGNLEDRALAIASLKSATGRRAANAAHADAPE